MKKYCKMKYEIGKRFFNGDGANQQVLRVVGVARDFNFEGLRKPVEAMRIVLSSRGNSIAVRADESQRGLVVEKWRRFGKAASRPSPLSTATLTRTFTSDIPATRTLKQCFQYSPESVCLFHVSGFLVLHCSRAGRE